MAVAPTGAIYKTLTFDGVSSADFGVYITGEAVFNAPERDVEMVTIPGRNGTFALDNGRFENIEVSYPAGIFADTEADFAEAVSEFRNFLCSRNGYVRLEDDYNSSEYRMSVYKSGLEVTPALLKAGEFTLTFDCKPQRWLTSGEEAVSVESGDTITNPTRFESGPLLEVEGSGDIVLNGETISILGGAIGEYTASPVQTFTAVSAVISFNDSLLNTGDTVGPFTGVITSGLVFESPEDYITQNDTATGNGNAGTISVSASRYSTNVNIQGQISVNPYSYGTARTDTTTFTHAVSSYLSGSISITSVLTVQYDGANSISVSLSCTANHMGPNMVAWWTKANELKAYSSQSVLGNPLYIDLDIGEAYKIEGGVLISVNSGFTIPTELPTLKVGANTITFDNTIVDLKVRPRWWKV